jgi:hypothetical protein
MDEVVLDLDELERLAKNATPGPWVFSPERDTHDYMVHTADAQLGE